MSAVNVGRAIGLPIGLLLFYAWPTMIFLGTFGLYLHFTAHWGWTPVLLVSLIPTIAYKLLRRG